MAGTPFKRRFWLPVGILMAFVAAGLLIYLAQPKLEPPPLPNPNGYDDFVKAGKALVGDGSDYETKTRDELVRFVAANSNTFQFIAVGLSKESRVPADYQHGYTTDHFPSLSVNENLAWALKAKGYLAEREGRTNDAAHAYLDCTLFGVQCGHGGLMVDYLRSFSCEKLCTVKLANIMPVLDASVSREYARALEKADNSSESPENILTTEKAWSSRIYGIRYRLATILYWRVFKQANDKFKKSFYQTQRQRRQLILDLATQAYKQENGHLPDSANQLVPQYLKTVPLDPETGAPLRIGLMPTAK